MGCKNSTTTVRDSWYSLDESSKTRIVEAIDRMLKDGSFFSIAKLHGWPDNQERRQDGSSEYGYCEHATERFGGWHRAYLYHFESLLQNADKANGRDGSIGLPYWDWCKNPSIPTELMQWREFPISGIPEQYRYLVGMDEQSRAAFSTPSGGILLSVPNNRVGDKTNEVKYMWRLHNFPQFISKDGPNVGGYRDLEQIHDSIHGEVAGVMQNLDLAAFSPIFWVHHSNIDRLFQTYLELNRDSESEVSRDAISRPLEPWNTAVSTTFELRGVRYDQLAYDLVPQALMEARNQITIRMFSEKNTTPSSAARDVTEPIRFRATTTIRITVDPKKLNRHSFNVYAFAVSIGQQDFVPYGHPSRWDKHKYFVGRCTILHGRDVRFCSNCQRSKPMTLNLDIGHGLAKLGINRNHCDIIVLYHDLRSGRIYSDKQVYVGGMINNGTPHIFTGPFFVDSTDLQKGVQSADVLRLQKYLTVKGWYDGKIDGIFYGRTRIATINFQKFFGLKSDAVWGPKSKDLILNKSNLNEEPDNNGDFQNFAPAAKITYALRGFPRNLKHVQLLKEIDRAFDQWEPHCGLTFHRVPSNQKADVSILWEDITDDNLLGGHGRGGLLAKSDRTMILFDESERWIQQNFDHVPYLGGYFFYNVMLHHVGKVIGLSNSGHRDDIMYPFYDSTKKTLSEGDVEAAMMLYRTQGCYGKQRCHPRQVGVKRVQSRGRRYQRNLMSQIDEVQKQKAKLDPIRRGGSVVGYFSGAKRLNPRQVPKIVNLREVPTIMKSPQVDYAKGIPSNQGNGYVMPGNSNVLPEYIHRPEPVLKPKEYENKGDAYMTSRKYNNKIGGSRNVFQM